MAQAGKAPPKPVPKVTVIKGKPAEAMMSAMKEEAKEQAKSKGRK
jgi:hypothetical protein